MRVLRVGDPHVKPTNIEESEALMGFVCNIAIDLKIDVLEILGDFYDTHSMVHLLVLKFWHKWLTLLSQKSFKTIVLVGNHDMSGDYSDNFSALWTAFPLENENFKIVYEPHLRGKFGYLPYIHENEKFVEEANKLAEQGATVLISHPNYEGAVYDNGTPITKAVDPNTLDSKFLHLIGGHIHTELEMGRVWYTGNPRWLTKACANKRKGIWLVTHDDNTGAILSKEFISTESVCTPIIALTWKEGENKPVIPDNAKVNMELVGSSDWVTKQKYDLKGISVSSKITDIKKSRERKSGKSLFEFLSNYYTTDKRDKLIEYMKGLNLV